MYNSQHAEMEGLPENPWTGGKDVKYSKQNWFLQFIDSERSIKKVKSTWLNLSPVDNAVGEKLGLETVGFNVGKLAGFLVGRIVGDAVGVLVGVKLGGF